MIDLKSKLALTALLTALNGTALPAAAQSFSAPQGCEAFLTVQSRACTVAHYWTCSEEDEGLFWRVSVDEDGPFYLTQLDADYRWLQQYSLRRDSRSSLKSEIDPANMDELFETGRDDMDFTIEQVENGVAFDQRYQGYDQISGASVEIDGEELLLTEFSYTFNSEDGDIVVAGNQFLSPDRRMFFSGIDTVTFADGNEVTSDGSPREFIDPGEDGFLSMRPIYECGDTMGALPPDPMLPPNAAG